MTAPCKECPFRKSSPPGWLGGHKNSREIINVVQFDQRFPCHMKVTALVTNDGVPFKRAVVEADLCAGALVFMNNNCKRSRDREVAKAQDEVEHCDDVFEWAHEMEAHHDGSEEKTG